MKRKESLAELRQRIAKSTLKPEDLRINRPPYRKTSDLFASEFTVEALAPSWPPSVCAGKAQSRCVAISGPYLKVLSETEASFAEQRQRRASSMAAFGHQARDEDELLML